MSRERLMRAVGLSMLALAMCTLVSACAGPPPAVPTPTAEPRQAEVTLQPMSTPVPTATEAPARTVAANPTAGDGVAKTDPAPSAIQQRNPGPSPSSVPSLDPTTDVAPTSAPSSTTPVGVSQRVDVLMSSMTVDEKIGQLLMLGFVGSSAADASSLISTYKPGSIAFVDNTKNASQTRALTQGLQSLAGQAGAGIPLFIAIDQEGGQVQRLKTGVTYFPSKLTLGATSDVQMAQLEGKVEGTELHALGVNMNLGPVLDVDSNTSNPIIGAFQRSISADPETVANLGGAYIDALQSQQVVAVAKHFPVTVPQRRTRMWLYRRSRLAWTISGPTISFHFAISSVRWAA